MASSDSADKTRNTDAPAPLQNPLPVDQGDGPRVETYADKLKGYHIPKLPKLDLDPKATRGSEKTERPESSDKKLDPPPEAKANTKAPAPLSPAPQATSGSAPAPTTLDKQETPRDDREDAPVHAKRKPKRGTRGRRRGGGQAPPTQRVAPTHNTGGQPPSLMEISTAPVVTKQRATRPDHLGTQAKPPPFPRTQGHRSKDHPSPRRNPPQKRGRDPSTPRADRERRPSVLDSNHLPHCECITCSEPSLPRDDRVTTRRYLEETFTHYEYGASGDEGMLRRFQFKTRNPPALCVHGELDPNFMITIPPLQLELGSVYVLGISPHVEPGNQGELTIEQLPYRVARKQRCWYAVPPAHYPADHLRAPRDSPRPQRVARGYSPERRDNGDYRVRHHSASMMSPRGEYHEVPEVVQAPAAPVQWGEPTPQPPTQPQPQPQPPPPPQPQLISQPDPGPFPRRTGPATQVMTQGAPQPVVWVHNASEPQGYTQPTVMHHAPIMHYSDQTIYSPPHQP